MYFYQKLLNALEIDDVKYQELVRPTSISEIEDPLNFQNIEKAIDRIRLAINNREKIMIYGDYDCDGICSTSILVKAFNKINYQVGYYIPSRYKNGYGINEEMVDLINQKGYKLIITVDNGVSQIDAIRKAKNYGIDVIVTDHHEILKDIPDCYCLVHPFLKKKDILPQCGAYVAFMISILLLGKIDPYLLSLASLATISDMMPLLEYNRILVKNGIKLMNENKYPQFGILLNYEKIDETSLSYSLAPKINAIGRVKDDTSVNKVVKYFNTKNLDELVDLANYINEVNEERRQMCNEAFSSIKIDDNDDKINVVLIPSLKEGLIGLVASRLVNQFKKPAIVFTRSENNLLKGSGRSLEGFSLADSFNQLGNLLVAYGGHALAGGLTIEEEKFEIFKKEINLLAKNSIFTPKNVKIIEMDIDDFSYENFLLIKNLSPYGESFEEPLLSYKINKNQITFIGNLKQHFKGIINSECSFVHFNYDQEIINSQIIELLGNLELHSYKGNNQLVFKVKEIRKGDN